MTRVGLLIILAPWLTFLLILFMLTGCSVATYAPTPWELHMRQVYRSNSDINREYGDAGNGGSGASSDGGAAAGASGEGSSGNGPGK